MKEIYCPKCQRTYSAGSFCPVDGSKLLTRITSTVEFMPIRTKRSSEELKSDARRWLERIGVSDIVFSSENNIAQIEYVLNNRRYIFRSTLQERLTDNIAAIEQFLHYRVLGIERGIETSEQAFAGYAELEHMSKDYFAGVNTRDEANNRYKDLAKKLHPDRNNGNNEGFVELQKQYEAILRTLE